MPPHSGVPCGTASGKHRIFLKYVTEIVLLRVADLFRDDIRLVVSCHQKLDRAPQPDIGR